ncbi:MAG: sigma-70 family RNA polymerase sigma factor [Eubacteriales bacterium]|nr:sigma-70 family RNA polymerase sigma factor [Eubacteriales bacterium]
MQRLAEKAAKGDAEAFLELMEQNSMSMYKVARGILKNQEDVADAVQETILSCFEKIHTLRKAEYFKTWLIRILINTCNQILRENRRELLPGEMPEEARSDPSLAEFEFQEMLGMVDEKYRLVLILYYVEGFRVQEIAALLDMKENTVKTRLSRARAQLKAEYGVSREKKKTEGRELTTAQGGFLDERRISEERGFSGKGGFSGEGRFSNGRRRSYAGMGRGSC